VVIAKLREEKYVQTRETKRIKVQLLSNSIPKAED